MVRDVKDIGIWIASILVQHIRPFWCCLKHASEVG
jgi:hypothetical protein